jgi:DNA-binding Lrp family transcriptional regulator
MYYQELLGNDHVQSQRALAKRVEISQTKIHLILQMLKLDEEIKDFILRLDNSDPRLSFLAVYRLQPLLQVKSKERQRRGILEVYIYFFLCASKVMSIIENVRLHS